MPQVTGSGKIRKITFGPNDWLGGLHPQGNGDASEGKLDLLGKLSIATAFNPFRMLGYGAPGYDAQDPTNYASVGAYLKKGVVDTSSIYATSNGAELHKITIGATPAVVDDATWPYSITAHGGANTPVLDDAVVYQADKAGTSTRMLFYSWTDSVSWDVGIYDLSATFDDDWMQTQPASTLGSPYTTGGQGKAHPMEIGEDDILYIGDRNFIHEYDGGVGTDGTFSPAVLTIPKGFEIRSLAKFPQFLVAFAYRASTLGGGSYYQGEAKAFFWDYLSQDPTYVFDLGDNFVGEAFSYKGTVGVFTQGRTNDLESGGDRNSKLQLFSGFDGGFEPVAVFNTDVPNRGGVFVNDNMIHWNSEGNHYTYGMPYGGASNVLNRIARGATQSVVSGLLMNPSTANYIMSPSSASSARIKYFKSGNYTDATIVSTVSASPDFEMGMFGRVVAVEVFFAKPSTGGRSVTITITNQAQDSEQIVTAVSTVASASIVQEFKDPGKRLPFTSLKAYIDYDSGSGNGDAPIIDRIEVYFESINIKKT